MMPMCRNRLPVPVYGPQTDAPPRSRSLMRNSSVEISSILFGTDERHSNGPCAFPYLGKKQDPHIYRETYETSSNSI